jgi:hypothetical protein
MSEAARYFGIEPQLSVIHTDLKDQNAGTRRTLQRMGEIIRKEANAPLVLDACKYAGILSGSRLQRAQGCWEWIAQYVRFQSDEPILNRLGFEQALDLLIEPSLLLTMPAAAGDCDCQELLAGAMLTRVGVPVELVATKSDEDDRDRWSHVFLQVVLEDGRRYTIDCSHGLYPGWEVPRQYARIVYNLQGKEINPPMPYRNNRGLGAPGDTSEADFGNYGYDEPWTSDVYYGSDAGNIGRSGTGTNNWSNILGGLVQTWGKTGAAIAQQNLAPLNVGEYVVNPDGSVRARAVPGALPSSALSLGGGTSFSPVMLFGIAALIGAAVIFGSKR